MQPLPRTRSCFVCGVSNPLGFRLQMHTDGRLAEARFQFRPEHVGFRNTIHGGLISTVLDEVMVWACGVVARKFSYCAELTVRFRKPVLPGHDVLAQAELTEDKRGRLFLARGVLRDPSGPDVYAEATGKYVPMDSEGTRFMGEDFIEETANILGPMTTTPSPASGS
jgi:acyl-coenzyme A thioesterase PaaI-like protein